MPYVWIVVAVVVLAPVPGVPDTSETEPIPNGKPLASSTT